MFTSNAYGKSKASTSLKHHHGSKKKQHRNLEVIMQANESTEQAYMQTMLKLIELNCQNILSLGTDLYSAFTISLLNYLDLNERYRYRFRNQIGLDLILLNPEARIKVLQERLQLQCSSVTPVDQKNDQAHSEICASVKAIKNQLPFANIIQNLANFLEVDVNLICNLNYDGITFYSEKRTEVNPIFMAYNDMHKYFFALGASVERIQISFHSHMSELIQNASSLDGIVCPRSYTSLPLFAAASYSMRSSLTQSPLLAKYASSSNHTSNSLFHQDELALHLLELVYQQIKLNVDYYENTRNSTLEARNTTINQNNNDESGNFSLGNSSFNSHSNNNKCFQCANAALAKSNSACGESCEYLRTMNYYPSDMEDIVLRALSDVVQCAVIIIYSKKRYDTANMMSIYVPVQPQFHIFQNQINGTAESIYLAKNEYNQHFDEVAIAIGSAGWQFLQSNIISIMNVQFFKQMELANKRNIIEQRSGTNVTDLLESLQQDNKISTLKNSNASDKHDDDQLLTKRDGRFISSGNQPLLTNSGNIEQSNIGNENKSGSQVGHLLTNSRIHSCDKDGNVSKQFEVADRQGNSTTADSTKRVVDIKQKFIKTKEKILNALAKMKDSGDNINSTNNLSPITLYECSQLRQPQTDDVGDISSTNTKSLNLISCTSNMHYDNSINSQHHKQQHRYPIQSGLFRNPVVVASATAPPLSEEAYATNALVKENVQQYPSEHRLGLSISIKKSKKSKDSAKTKLRSRLAKSDSIKQKQQSYKANSITSLNSSMSKLRQEDDVARNYMTDATKGSIHNTGIERNYSDNDTKSKASGLANPSSQRMSHLIRHYDSSERDNLKVIARNQQQHQQLSSAISALTIQQVDGSFNKPKEIDIANKTHDNITTTSSNDNITSNIMSNNGSNVGGFGVGDNRFEFNNRNDDTSRNTTVVNNRNIENEPNRIMTTYLSDTTRSYSTKSSNDKNLNTNKEIPIALFNDDGSEVGRTNVYVTNAIDNFSNSNKKTVSNIIYEDLKDPSKAAAQITNIGLHGNNETGNKNRFRDRQNESAQSLPLKSLAIEASSDSNNNNDKNKIHVGSNNTVSSVPADNNSLAEDQQHNDDVTNDYFPTTSFPSYNPSKNLNNVDTRVHHNKKTIKMSVPMKQYTNFTMDNSRLAKEIPQEQSTKRDSNAFKNKSCNLLMNIVNNNSRQVDNSPILSRELMEKALTDNEKDQIKYLIDQINLHTKDGQFSTEDGKNETSSHIGIVSQSSSVNYDAARKQGFSLLERDPFTRNDNDGIVISGGDDDHDKDGHVDNHQQRHIYISNQQLIKRQRGRSMILMENLAKLNCECVNIDYGPDSELCLPIKNDQHLQHNSTFNDDGEDMTLHQKMQTNGKHLSISNNVITPFDHNDNSVNSGSGCFEAIARSIILIAGQGNNDTLMYLQHRLKLSTSLSINKRTNLKELNNQIVRRLQKLCIREWKRNKHRYATYMINVDFEKEIQKFADTGNCCAQLENAVPLSVANSVGLRIQIITSMREYPLLQITPDKLTTKAKKDMITLILTLDQEATIAQKYGVAMLKNSLLGETWNSRIKNSKSVTFSDTPEIRTFERSDAEKAELLEWQIERNRNRRDKNLNISQPVPMNLDNNNIIPHHHVLISDGIPLEFGGVGGSIITAIPLASYPTIMPNTAMQQQLHHTAGLPTTYYHHPSLANTDQAALHAFYPPQSATSIAPQTPPPTQASRSVAFHTGSQHCSLFQHPMNNHLMMGQHSTATNNGLHSHQQQSQHNVPIFPIGGYIPNTGSYFSLFTNNSNNSSINNGNGSMHSKMHTNPQLIQRTSN
ncbi:hypothetical protein GJ496_011693 [Pomphorhynchus laevis]|nr:hypothetical protein GJ496_011693 [Pomphorhynchus laevis]